MIPNRRLLLDIYKQQTVCKVDQLNRLAWIDSTQVTGRNNHRFQVVDGKAVPLPFGFAIHDCPEEHAVIRNDLHITQLDEARIHLICGNLR